MSQSTCDALLFFAALIGTFGALFLMLFGLPMLIEHLTRDARRKHLDALEEEQRERIAQHQRWREDAKTLANEPFNPLRQSELYDRP